MEGADRGENTVAKNCVGNRQGRREVEDVEEDCVSWRRKNLAIEVHELLQRGRVLFFISRGASTARVAKPEMPIARATNRPDEMPPPHRRPLLRLQWLPIGTEELDPVLVTCVVVLGTDNTPQHLARRRLGDHEAIPRQRGPRNDKAIHGLVEARRDFNGTPRPWGGVNAGRVERVARLDVKRAERCVRDAHDLCNDHGHARKK
mmetsp:Transcript_15922/g.43675  ORF Transcript_15922/g.43675 Transcript_15922/m.43675 type:complete len:204 (-) Transcript_15922:22-633(-)